MTMTKIKLAPRPFLYPKPAVLVGALVRGRPNFMTIANCGIVGYDPPVVSVSSFRGHYTNAGIRRAKTFSVNIPSAAMAAVTDFCGLYSGRKTDKSGLFEVYYGELKTAPLIAACPISLECRLVRTCKLHDEEVFLGEIVAIWADKKCMTGGRPDIKKADPLIYSTSDKKYFRIGREIGRAYSIGKRKKPAGRKKGR